MIPELVAIALIILLIYWIVPKERFGVNETRVITLHYTNWCPHCKNIKPIWAAVRAATEGSRIRFKEVDEDIAHTPGVRSYPTILMLAENGHTYRYGGGPDFNKLRNWVVSPQPVDQ